MQKLTVSTRLYAQDADRVLEMAKREQRPLSAMVRILVLEALAERECRELAKNTTNDPERKRWDRK